MKTSSSQDFEFAAEWSDKMSLAFMTLAFVSRPWLPRHRTRVLEHLTPVTEFICKLFFLDLPDLVGREEDHPYVTARLTSWYQECLLENPRGELGMAAKAYRVALIHGAVQRGKSLPRRQINFVLNLLSELQMRLETFANIPEEAEFHVRQWAARREQRSLKELKRLTETELALQVAEEKADENEIFSILIYVTCRTPDRRRYYLTIPERGGAFPLAQRYGYDGEPTGLFEGYQELVEKLQEMNTVSETVITPRFLEVTRSHGADWEDVESELDELIGHFFEPDELQFVHDSTFYFLEDVEGHDDDEPDIVGS